MKPWPGPGVATNAPLFGAGSECTAHGRLSLYGVMRHEDVVFRR